MDFDVEGCVKQESLSYFLTANRHGPNELKRYRRESFFPDEAVGRYR